MRKVSVLLITVALIAGMVGCAVEVDPAPQPQVKHRLTILSQNGGWVTAPGEGVFDYDDGAVVVITATPASGYRFDGWVGDVATVFDVNMASTTITMSADYSVIASFAVIPPPQCRLTVSSTSGGSVAMPGEGAFKYDAGTVVNLTAEAWEGHKFFRWSGDVNTIFDVDAAATTVTMEGDYTISASFLEAHLYLDQIGPGVWSLGVNGEGVEASVTEEGLVVSFGSHPRNYPDWGPNPGFAGRGYTIYTVEGDFDIRVYYELTRWPQLSGVRVGLSVFAPHVPDKFLNVERTGLGDMDFPGEPREVYLVNCDDNQIHGFIETDDLSGTLRVCREGETVSGYYMTSEGWRKIYEGEWYAGDVHIAVGPWSHENVFGGEEVSVFLRTVEIIEGLP